MVTFCMVVFILAVIGVLLGICGAGVAIVFGDAFIGIALVVLIIKKIFKKKDNGDEEKK